jgi:hypothetical protein
LFVFIKYDISNSSSYALEFRPHFPWKIPHFRGKIMFLNTNEHDRKSIPPFSSETDKYANSFANLLIKALKYFEKNQMVPSKNSALNM